MSIKSTIAAINALTKDNHIGIFGGNLPAGAYDVLEDGVTDLKSLAASHAELLDAINNYIKRGVPGKLNCQCVVCERLSKAIERATKE